MTNEQFKNYLKKDLNKWLVDKDIVKLTCEYPDLVWDFEDEVFTLEEINKSKQSKEIKK